MRIACPTCPRAADQPVLTPSPPWTFAWTLTGLQAEDRVCVCVYVCAFVCDRWSTIRPGSPLLKVSLTTQRDGWTGVSFSSSWAQYRFENITNVPNTFDQAYPLCKKNNNKQESSAPQMAERDVQDRHSSLQLQKNKLRWISFRLHCMSDCQRTANQPRPDSQPSMDIGVDFGGPPSQRRGCVWVCLST